MRTKKIVKIDRFDNFSAENAIKTKTFYNYLPTNKLNTTHGIKIATFPKSPTNRTEQELNIADVGITSIEGIGYFKQFFDVNHYTSHRLIVYGNDKKVYINQLLDDSYDLFWLYNLEFNSPPVVLPFKKEGLDSIIMVSDDQMKVWTTGFSPYTIEDAPIVTSMCMNESVLFCTIANPGYKIWYATNLSMDKIGRVTTGSGYITLEDNLGDAKKVVAFNEGVYAFRDYGISKINHIKGENLVSQIYVSNTKIYTNTVCVCGNNIFFMTKDGLYSFNGVKVSKTKVSLLNDMPIENEGAISAAMGEKYYLALKLNFDDEKDILCEPNSVNNVLIIIDTTDFSYEIIRGLDIKTLLPVKLDEFEKMLVLFNTGPVDKIGEVVDTPKYVDEILPKFWASENLVDTMNMKLFTKLTVDAFAGVKFTLKYDDKEINFTTFKSGINEFLFKIMCKDIKLEISTEDENGVVNKVELEYYEY